ncbi:MAG: zinc ribbon domain-containing protein [Candidatus Delongbacteria bacterium]|nr:zinc ribbon domain-containing protein [Candidatus Delongbacteria bacterium]MCG2760816.1 zinc ribbon domain-containing protein [Candidatus Delongbacteria bacterium]
MKPCRDCGNEVSESAYVCPKCGAPRPANEKWDGYGFEYKSPLNFFGLPLIHISFKYRQNKTPVVAKGIIAIGQFGMGVINISQIGIGVVSVSQFTVGVYALAQFAFAYSLMAQVGLYIESGYGQVVVKLADILAKF